MEVSKKPVVIHEDFQVSVDNLQPLSSIKQKSKFLRFLNLAEEMAHMSDFNKMKLGATIILKGKVISKAFNTYKGHPIQKFYNQNRNDHFKESTQHALHAELSALNKVKNLDLRGAEIYIYHMNNQGNPKMGRPCAGCMDAIKQRGISKIHYTTPDGIATEEISQDKIIVVKKSKKVI